MLLHGTHILRALGGGGEEGKVGRGGEGRGEERREGRGRREDRGGKGGEERVTSENVCVCVCAFIS